MFDNPTDQEVLEAMTYFLRKDGVMQPEREAEELLPRTSPAQRKLVLWTYEKEMKENG